MDSENSLTIIIIAFPVLLFYKGSTTRANGAMVILRPATTLGMVADISGDNVSVIDTTFTNRVTISVSKCKKNQMYSIEARKDRNAVFIKSVNLVICIAYHFNDSGLRSFRHSCSYSYLVLHNRFRKHNITFHGEGNCYISEN
jgi:hypothetical protein